MSSRTLLTATAVAVLILSVVGVASVLRSRVPAESPSEPAQPVSITSTTNPSPSSASEYWTPERMRSAQPAPMTDE